MNRGPIPPASPAGWTSRRPMSKRRPGSGVLFARCADSRSAGRRFTLSQYSPLSEYLMPLLSEYGLAGYLRMRPAEIRPQSLPPKSAWSDPRDTSQPDPVRDLTPSLGEFGQRGRDLEVIRHRGVGTRPGVQNWDRRSWLAHRNSIPFFWLNFRVTSADTGRKPTETNASVCPWRVSNAPRASRQACTAERALPHVHCRVPACQPGPSCQLWLIGLGMLILAGL
jgi:hypothetical protein